jgi:hypothetical protein
MTYITKFGEIPKEHLITRDGVEFVRFGGLLWLAQQEGVYRCETKDVSINPDVEIVYECKGWLIPNSKYLEVMGIDKESPLLDMFRQPIITHGTTNPQNLRANMAPHRTVMAETRAIVRNLRILTGCSLCGEDELDTYQFIPEKLILTAKNAGITMTSAVDMLDAQAEPKDRKQYIVAIESLKGKNAGVQTYIESFLDGHNANMLVNLSDPLLKELYNKSLELIAE